MKNNSSAQAQTRWPKAAQQPAPTLHVTPTSLTWENNFPKAEAVGYLQDCGFSGQEIESNLKNTGNGGLSFPLDDPAIKGKYDARPRIDLMVLG
jgi:hypothetical protein